MRYFEEVFECGGVCDMPLFYATKSISDGLPEQDCIDAVIESELNNGFIAGFSLATGLVFVLLGFSAIPCGARKRGMGSKHIELVEDGNN